MGRKKRVEEETPSKVVQKTSIFRRDRKEKDNYPSEVLLLTGDIGRMIKDRRKLLGISQQMLAEKLGLTYQQIQRYENGKNKISVESIQIIARVLGLPASYFFKEGKASPGKKQSRDNVPLNAEERKLLKKFRKIQVKSIKLQVISLVSLAARVPAR